VPPGRRLVRPSHAAPVRQLASWDFEVVDAAYDYDRAVAAGSDHGMVAATLQLRA